MASDRSIGHAREVAGEEAREWGGGAGPGVLKNESFVLELDKDDLVGVGGRLEGLPISSSVKERDAANDGMAGVVKVLSRRASR